MCSQHIMSLIQLFHRCAAGYYGNPTDVGGFCRKCHCGGNIDLSVPDSCDNMTGACKICTGDTEGTKCEHCKVGFYGSAHAAGCQRTSLCSLSCIFISDVASHINCRLNVKNIMSVSWLGFS